MASVTNAFGISADEYSNILIDTFRHLFFIKGVEIPTIDDLKAQNKLVTIDSITNDDKKSKLHSTISFFISLITKFYFILSYL